MKRFAAILGLAILLCVPAWSEETKLPEDKPKIEDVYSDLETFANAITIIDAHYVEKKEPKQLIYGALKGLLSSLDPYSQFLDPEAYNEIRVETEGKFGGIGVEITFRDGILTVISPVDGTPAEQAGILAGDKIVRIDGKSTRDMALDDAVKVLRGKAGVPVKLTVLREGEGKLLEFVLSRAIIKVKSVKDAQVFRGGIGYIRLSEFQENTPRDLRAALKKLEEQNIKGLILDLRNNPGGLLSVAVEVAEEFIPQGEMVVYTKGRTAEQEMRFLSEGVREKKAYPIVVLVNHGSASAAEIVAGALRDHDLAVLMGTKTFGKGSVQTVIPMRDGSAIRLTTAKYFTPSGDLIHGIGIEPNIEVPFERIEAKKTEGTAKKKEDAQKLFDEVEKDDGSGKVKPPQAPEKEGEANRLDRDNQVQRAIDLIAALNVYGVKTHEAQKPKAQPVL